MRRFRNSNLPRKAWEQFKKNFSWRKFFQWALRLFAVGLALIAFLFLWYAKDLPDPNKLLAREIPQSTKIYARDGSLLYEIHGEVKRTLIPFSEMNDNIKHATIAIEDKNFYKEGGLDLRGIFRSLFIDAATLNLSQGGSTITQQFVRNAILTREKTLPRKIKEAILSLEINERFSKDNILKLYLNEIPYGRNAYGIEAASQAYFGVHAKDLTLAQAAYLAALPQAPSLYNPMGPHRTLLDQRKNVVLDQMRQQGYISQSQQDQAKAETVAFIKNSDPIIAPHFVVYIQDYLSQKYGESTLENGGLKVTTTLDPNLQKIAEKAVADGSANNQKKYNAYNASLVAIDPKTGQILAMVGSKNYYGQPEPAGCKPGVNCAFEPSVNTAIAQRQPGSSGKPYIYGTAFKPQFKQSPATLRMDIITNFGTYGGKDYIPHNYTGQEYGPVSIRQALDGSLNISAVKTLAIVGVDNAIQTMRDFGITSPLKDCGLSLVLGGCEVRLLDHVSGYSTFATEGMHHQATGILRVENGNGNVLEQYQDQAKQVMDPQAAYLIDNVLSDNNARAFVFGLHSPLTLGDRPVAAKTGTSQNFRDGWTLGFTPSLAAGVWVGNNDGRLLKSGADGVVVAAPIWHAFMQEALKGTPAEDFQAPQGIAHVTVDALSGLLPNAYTPTTKSEVFADYSVPTQADNVHIVASANCSTFIPTPQQPACDPTPKLYTALHSEMPDNPNWENPVVAWVNAHASQGYGYPPPGSVISSGGTVPGGQNSGGSGSGNSGNSGGTGQTADPGQPPVVSITTPADRTTVTSLPLRVSANIIPDTNNKITRVDFLVDGTIVTSATNGPYSFQIDQMGEGTHIIAIHAVDDKGNTGDDSATINYKPVSKASIQMPEGVLGTYTRKIKK